MYFKNRVAHTRVGQHGDFLMAEIEEKEKKRVDG